MLNTSKLTDYHLQRKAIVYVRQSSPTQALHHLESQRLQYELQEKAQHMGFQVVEVIDRDLATTATGSVERGGLEYLFQQLISRQIGAIFCSRACRLARNGREWQTLLELAAFSHVLLIDSKTIYDPNHSDDRLMLGLQGSFAEYEVSVLRQRASEAIYNKAKRGELQFQLAVGFCWNEDCIKLTPDLQVQATLRSVFTKFRELESARQVYLWFLEKDVLFPRVVEDSHGQQLSWTKPTYDRILRVLKNPFYAGAYVYGRRTREAFLEAGKVRKRKGVRKPQEDWTVLLQEHHPGYISWREYEENQRILEANRPMSEGRPGPVTGRASLLNGIVRCGHCNQKMYSSYTGNPVRHRYRCKPKGRESYCSSVSGRVLEGLMEQQLMEVVQPLAIQAALEAATQLNVEQERTRELLSLEYERARYEAQVAERRYKQVDPDNRLVASSLEKDWNEALKRQEELRVRLEEFLSLQEDDVVEEELLELATKLPMVWEHPETKQEVKQRIVRLVLEEVVVRQEENERVMVLHWVGGRHSEIRISRRKKKRVAEQQRSEVVLDTLKKYASLPDSQLAEKLNEMGLCTSRGLCWNQRRVRSVRQAHGLPSFDARQEERVNLKEAAERLGLSQKKTRKLLREGVLEGEQTMAQTSWSIPVASLESEAVQQYVEDMKKERSRR